MKIYFTSFLITISSLVFGQKADTILVQPVVRDTLVTDSIVIVQQQLDHLTTIINIKTKELDSLKKQQSVLLFKFSSFQRKDTLNKVVVSDTLSKQDTISIPVVTQQKETSFVEDVAEKLGFLFEVTSCKYFQDSVRLYAHVKGLQKYSNKSVFIMTRVTYHTISRKKAKNSNPSLGFLNLKINPIDEDQYLPIRVFIDKKRIPSGTDSDRIMDIECYLYIKIDVTNSLRKNPINIVEWENMNSIYF